jgi:hypothetical protein
MIFDKCAVMVQWGKKNQHFSTNGYVNLWEKINLNPYLIPYRTVSLNES